MATYKIKDLEQLTGIKAHTIRIWEKRYNILKPERSETQIRQYDDHDLTLLLNISLLNKRGVKISKLSELTPKEIQQLAKRKLNEFSIDVFHENLLKSLIELDEYLFKKTINELVDEIGMTQAYTEHILPFLQKIGVMWLVGSINPAQEHFISNLIRQKLIVEIEKIELKEPIRKAILYLPEHETHELSLIFYDYILRNKGIQTFYLGQMLPFDSLIESIDKIQPDWIVSSWITQVDNDYTFSYFKRLKAHFSNEILVGGAYIKELYTEDLGKQLTLIESLDSFHHLQ